jgi:phenylpropionate dioxygenase-like ring-hydroxylating dioxygenase large terminal subunit
MTYLKNAWYVAGWASELKAGTMTHRRLLDEPVLLYRDSSGKPSALLDRCPHRLVPLHKGKVIGDAIQCGYHGLQFNGRGACVHNPHGAIPCAAQVRSFPLVERHSVLWIWMGKPALANPASIPDYGFQDPERSYVGESYLHVRSNYVLEVDNIMDLSHTEFLHATTLGSSGISQGDYRAERDGDTVWSRRVTRAEVMTDDLAQAMGIVPGTPADRWLHVRWNAPANMALFAGAVPTGQPFEQGRETPTAHCFTPETSSTTHYWFSICFPKSMGESGARAAREQIAYIRGPFEAEDLPMLEAQQNAVGDVDLLSLKPVLLAGDAGAVHARRTLERLISQETQTP